MNYTCTRDNSISISASKAILAGISPDGGLFLPESIPAFSLEEISAMARLPYTGQLNWPVPVLTVLGLGLLALGLALRRKSRHG